MLALQAPGARPQLVPAGRRAPSLRSGSPLRAGARGALAAAAAARRPRSPPRGARAQAGGGSLDGGGLDSGEFALAPSKPTSPVGRMAAYYLQMQPHLFRDTVEAEFAKLAAAAAAAASSPGSEPDAGAKPAADSAELVLYRRMAEVAAAERRAAVEDLMYVCILERFRGLGVDMLPRLEPVDESVAALRALTEGVHSRAALEMVREHVMGVLGPASVADAATAIKMSKLQAAQVYAASVMFGYFLRRVDARFALAAAAGMLPEQPGDAVARLERLFAAADDMSASDDPDAAPPAAFAAAVDPDAPPPPPGAPGAAAASSSPSSSLARRPKGALRQYVESFDQAALLQVARLVTAEGAALVERQTRALFGDVKELQAQMQAAVGTDAGSAEELMRRVQAAVAGDAVETVTSTVGTQRRAVLEAIAYGCFLRDVEGWVDGDFHGLLTPAAAGA